MESKLIRVGTEPIQINRFMIEPSEMMFVQYMPIRMPYTDIRLPDNLKCFKRLVDATRRDIDDDSYVYITAKHFIVTPEYQGNRPGWHIDGFGTDDINYIWSDTMPTEFNLTDMVISTDHHESLRQMDMLCRDKFIRHYPVETLLRLDNKVVHRVARCPNIHLRTFVKISISRDQYDLKGNAHNPLFNYEWTMKDREETRNHTTRSPTQSKPAFPFGGDSWILDARL